MENYEEEWSSDVKSGSEAQSNVNSVENNENNLSITPYISKNVVEAAGFNVGTPIVNAIIGNLTGSLPTKKSEAELLRCDICDCELSSDVVLNLHVQGSKHKKKLKALEILAQLKEEKDKGVRLGISENARGFRCEICSLTVNSALQLEIHLTGAKHKKRAARAAAMPESESKLNENPDLSDFKEEEKTDSPSPKKKKKEDPKVIPCDICNVFMNSEIQYDQHSVSRKHLSRISWIQQQKKSPEKVKLIKFPHFTIAITESPMGTTRRVYKHSVQQNPQINKRLFPSSHFVIRAPFPRIRRIGDSTNVLRQPPAENFE